MSVLPSLDSLLCYSVQQVWTLDYDPVHILACSRCRAVLKVADIGCAMGSGAEISKDCADIILVDSNYNFSACWDNATIYVFNSATYHEITAEEKKMILLESSVYEPGVKNEDSSNNTSSDTSNTTSNKYINNKKIYHK